MSVFGLSSALTALILAGILSLAIFLPIFLWPHKPTKERIRFGGYQPTGPGLDTSNPPKGGSGVPKHTPGLYITDYGLPRIDPASVPRCRSARLRKKEGTSSA